MKNGHKKFCFDLGPEFSDRVYLLRNVLGLKTTGTVIDFAVKKLEDENAEKIEFYKRILADKPLPRKSFTY
jgi:hypothetical protein